MPFVPQSFARALRSLDTDGLGDFVAAIYRARGYTVERTSGPDDAVVLTATDGTSHRILVYAPGRFVSRSPTVPAETDLVVSSRRTAAVERAVGKSGARLLGPDDLHEMLSYAVDREAGEDLCRTHLGRSLSPGRATAAENRSSGRGVPVRSLGVALVVVLLLGVLAAPALSDAFSPSEDTEGVIGAGTATVTTPKQLAEWPTTYEPIRTTEGGRTLPPGVTRGGQFSLQRFTSGHAEAIADRPYRLTVTARNVLDPESRSWDRTRQVALVAEPGVYRYEVQGVLAFDRPGEYPLVDRETYADGENRYVRARTPRGVTYARVSLDGDRFVDQTTTYVRWFVGQEATVGGTDWRNGTLFYRVTSSTPSPVLTNVSNYTATAVVDSSGLVHRLSVSYVDRSGPFVENATFEMRVEPRNVTVAEPAWYGAARSAAGEGDDE